MFLLTPQQPRRGANTVNDMSRRSRTGTRASGISLFFVDEFRAFDMATTKSGQCSLCGSITGERQLQFQSRYHMERNLTLPLCLLVLAEGNGVAFTPRVSLPGEYTSDVHHSLLSGTPPCHVETTNRTKGDVCSRVIKI
ncbi:hypothetical protein AVEN_26976-1 [Araneus ventricosus]|uniref:Uncharacterized protein n=1 Tax=Araneus ventricosus TaxID=182803 RepID=A0A4Y2SAN2_ARAVE|nr:hypothetical protein AVEN_26976-1 [Araneus ventricosus]